MFQIGCGWAVSDLGGVRCVEGDEEHESIFWIGQLHLVQRGLHQD